MRAMKENSIRNAVDEDEDDGGGGAPAKLCLMDRRLFEAAYLKSHAIQRRDTRALKGSCG